MVEMGRFCIHPTVKDPDVLRVAWAAMARFVDETGTDLLFGCSSFWGCEAEGYLDAFAMLQARHLAPKRWLPRGEVCRISRALTGTWGPCTSLRDWRSREFRRRGPDYSAEPQADRSSAARQLEDPSVNQE